MKKGNGLKGKRSNAFKDRSGDKIGLLTVLHQVGWHNKPWIKHENALWLCECDCGNRIEIPSHRLCKKKSCGCLNKEKSLMGSGSQRLSQVVSKYKYSARQSNRIWEFTKKEAIEFLLKDCYYCGVPARSKHNPSHNGIDRLDNNEGYTLKNTVTACRICNFAKRDLPLDLFLSWVKRISTHQPWKKYF
jgi:hypothetical protein